MMLESMTATFGKLEGQTLTFHPALAISTTRSPAERDSCPQRMGKEHLVRLSSGHALWHRYQVPQYPECPLGQGTLRPLVGQPHVRQNRADLERPPHHH